MLRDDSSGQLGNGLPGTVSTVPVAVTTSGVLGGKHLARITGWGGDTCVLGTGRHAYCWGNDDNGQLGDGGTTDSLVPVTVVHW